MAATKLQVCMALMVAMAVASAELGEGALTCGQVGTGVASCLSYVMGKGPLTPGCCSGIKSINAAARTTADRQQACRCLKDIAASAKSINFGLAAGIPGKCGVSVGFPINPSVDCNK
ncbi:unnamed protein product [Linum tenue]|nr:unnamed protein product [Linum tenue]